jgi:hypothetical protein
MSLLKFLVIYLLTEMEAVRCPTCTHVIPDYETHCPCGCLTCATDAHTFDQSLGEPLEELSRGPLRKNYSFNPVQVSEIYRENDHLLAKLERIASKGGSVRQITSQPVPTKRSTQEINRRRQESKIIAENMVPPPLSN